MPDPKTYGDLKKDIGDLLERIDRVQGGLARRKTALNDLMLSIPSDLESTALDEVAGGQSALIGKVNDVVSSIVLPEEMWNC